MDSNGFSSTKIIGYEHNWSDAANYPVQLVRDKNDLWLEYDTDRLWFQMQQAWNAFDGVSFHCYEGTVSDQAEFTSQYPDKVRWASNPFEIHFESLLRKCCSRNVRALSAPIGGATSR